MATTFRPRSSSKGTSHNHEGSWPSAVRALMATTTGAGAGANMSKTSAQPAGFLASKRRARTRSHLRVAYRPATSRTDGHGLDRGLALSAQGQGARQRHNARWPGCTGPGGPGRGASWRLKPGRRTRPARFGPQPKIERRAGKTARHALPPVLAAILLRGSGPRPRSPRRLAPGPNSMRPAARRAPRRRRSSNAGPAPTQRHPGGGARRPTPREGRQRSPPPRCPSATVRTPGATR